MLSYDEALQTVIDNISPLPVQLRPLPQIAGLILAAPVRARWDMPRWDNSAMDGYAIAADDMRKSLKIVGTSYAGHPFKGSLGPGETIGITTGAPLPAGADTVVPVEDTLEDAGRLFLQQPVKPQQHVRYRGEEYRADEILLEAGIKLNAGAIGLLASAGVEQVEVYPRPKVAIFSTGDELVELGQEPGPGQIINSNLQYLLARVNECGGTSFPLGIGEDRCDDLEKLIVQALDADLILSTGGVSVGEKDLVQAALEKLGFKRKFWKVAIKPGKPVLFGLLQGKPCLGLPGNPAATAATFELFALPALRILAGRQATSGTRAAILTHEIKAGGKRQSFLWCRCDWQEDGYRVAIPNRQGSGQTRSVQGANALLSIPAGTACLHSGDQVDVILMER